MKDGMALIRQCDKCGQTTAFDLDVTTKHRREMQMVGQTVREVPKEEALKLIRAGAPIHLCTKKCGDCASWRDDTMCKKDYGSGYLPEDQACKNFKEKI